MTVRFAALALLGVAICGAPTLLAAQAESELTLRDALAIARQRNPAYRRARAQFSSAASSVRAGWGAFLPNVTANMNFSGNSRTTVTGEDDFGEPVDLPQPITFRSSSVSQGVGADFTIFDGFSNINNFRAARRRADAAEHGMLASLVRLEGDVKRGFYDAVRTLRLIEVEEQLLVSNREQLDATERLFRVAGASQVDVLGAQVDLSRQELGVARARGGAHRSLLQLKQQIGVDPGQEFELVGNFPEPFDPTSIEVDSLVSRALMASPVMAQLRASGAAARSQASAARGQRLPTIRAGFDYRRNANLSGYDAFFQFDPRNRSWGFNLSVQIPLFDGFSTSRSIAEADMNAIIADEDLRDGVLRVGQQTRGAVIDLQIAYAGLQIELRALELSRQQLALAQEQYRLGAINFTNLQTVRDRAAQAERTAVNAEYDFAASLATLEEVVGGSIR